MCIDVWLYQPINICLCWRISVCIMAWINVSVYKNQCYYNRQNTGSFKQSRGARLWVGMGLSYLPARLHRLGEFIPWNRLLGSWRVLKFGLRALSFSWWWLCGRGVGLTARIKEIWKTLFFYRFQVKVDLQYFDSKRKLWRKMIWNKCFGSKMKNLMRN